jgi:hypothetical protein
MACPIIFDYKCNPHESRSYLATQGIQFQVGSSSGLKKTDKPASCSLVDAEMPVSCFDAFRQQQTRPAHKESVVLVALDRFVRLDNFASRSLRFQHLLVSVKNLPPKFQVHTAFAADETAARELRELLNGDDGQKPDASDPQGQEPTDRCRQNKQCGIQDSLCDSHPEMFGV